MSNNEAKFLLNAYRPSGVDANDPAFAEALNQAKVDPSLGAWFAREQAHSAAVAAKLREIAPPPGLREAILAGGKLTRAAGKEKPRRAWWTWGLALAASLAVMTTLFLRSRPTDARALVAFAIDDAAHGRHGGHGADEKKLQAELAQASAHLRDGLPLDLRALADSGCRKLRIGGHDLLEVCFVRNGIEFHCYVGRASDFIDDAHSPGTRLVQEGALAAATWVHGAYRYVVVSDRGIDAIKGLL